MTDTEYLKEFEASLTQDWNKLPMRIPPHIRAKMEQCLEIDAKVRELDARRINLYEIAQLTTARR